MNRDNRKMNFRSVPGRPAPRGPWKYNEPPKKKSSAGSILFTAAIVFLSFTLIITVVTAIHTYQDQLTWYNYHEDEDGLLRDYTYGNFAELMTEAYSDANIDRRYTDTEMCLHAVAEYYEAATLVRAFEAAGDEERAALYRKKLEALPEKMGEFSDAAEKIDAIVFGE